MKSTITTPDELTTLRIEGSSGTYKIFSSFRPMESPAFVDAVDRKYNLAEIKNLSGGKRLFPGTFEQGAAGNHTGGFKRYPLR